LRSRSSRWRSCVDFIVPLTLAPWLINQRGL
jgi:hypothetical protein